MPKFSERAEAFLKEPHFGKVATLMKDGSPQLTPVWYMYDGGKIVINTAEGRVKLRNIRRDPRVAFLVDNGYSYIMILGRARIARERDGKKDIETLAIRYEGEKEGRRAARSVYWKKERVSIEVVPERVVSGL